MANMEISAQMEAMAHASTYLMEGIMKSWPEDEPAGNPLPTVIMTVIVKAVRDPEWAAGFVASIPAGILQITESERGMLKAFSDAYEHGLRDALKSSRRNKFRKLF